MKGGKIDHEEDYEEKNKRWEKNRWIIKKKKKRRLRHQTEKKKKMKREEENVTKI